MLVCDACGEEFVPAACELAESLELFPDLTPEQGGVVCEECWPKFLAWMRKTYGPPPWLNTP